MKTLITAIGLFIAFCMGICGRVASAQTNSSIEQLAIVSESPEAGTVADVLTAEFTKNGNVHLLERAEIERVYQEQGLSAANRDDLKLGRLLGADGLLFLGTSPEGANQFLNVRLVAVKPGVVLVAERFPLPMKDLTGWSPLFARRWDPLLPKLAVLAKDAIPISVVNFHAGVRTATAAELEQQMFLITVERLTQETRLFVLERKSMQALSQEKEMNGTEAEPFWNGKYVLDGAIDRDGFNPEVVTINARLIPSDGKPILIDASGSRTNCMGVVNQLAEKILAALKLEASPTAWSAAMTRGTAIGFA